MILSTHSVLSWGASVVLYSESKECHCDTFVTPPIHLTSSVLKVNTNSNKACLSRKFMSLNGEITAKMHLFSLTHRSGIAKKKVYSLLKGYQSIDYTWQYFGTHHNLSDLETTEMVSMAVRKWIYKKIPIKLKILNYVIQCSFYWKLKTSLYSATGKFINSVSKKKNMPKIF